MQKVLSEIELKQLQQIELQILRDFHAFCEDNNLKYYLIGGALLGCVRYGGFIPWDDDIDVAMPREDYECLQAIWRNKEIPGYFLQNEKTDPLFSRAIMKLRLNGTKIIEQVDKDVQINRGIYIDIFPIDYANYDNAEALKRREKRIRRIMSLRAIKCGYINERYRPVKKMLKKFLALIPVTVFDNEIYRLSTLDNGGSREYMALYTHNYSLSKQIHKSAVFGRGTEKEFCGYKFYCPDDTNAFLSRVFGEDYLVEPPIEDRRNPHNYIELSFGCSNPRGGTY